MINGIFGDLFDFNGDGNADSLETGAGLAFLDDLYGGSGRSPHSIFDGEDDEDGEDSDTL